MSVLNQLKELYNHMHWADAKIWEAVVTVPDIQNNEDFKNVLYHMHLTQYAFYHVWSDLKLDFPNVSDLKNLSEIARWGSKYPELLGAFLSGLRESDLTRVIKIPWADRYGEMLGIKPSDTNLGETMFQVVGHSFHHRGQVNNLIRSYSGEPPVIDFIVWLWLGKPLAVWPAHKSE